MLINLTNHTSDQTRPEPDRWSALQYQTAIETWGHVLDLGFPVVPPEATATEIDDLASQYLNQCVKLFGDHRNKPGESNAVHVMGEMTFTYAMVNKLRDAGIMAVASTTDREVEADSRGNKVSKFRFGQFRPYFIL